MQIKNKDEKTLSKSELILNDIFKTLSESFHLERMLYDKQVERILSEI